MPDDSAHSDVLNGSEEFKRRYGGSHVWISSTVPCFRSMAHIITHDPSSYYQAHFGCVAYDYSRGPLSYEKRNDFTTEQRLYQCCNSKIQQLDLTRSRHALLKVLLLKTPDNFEAFAATLTCDQHRDDDCGAVSWTRSLWFNEMTCRNRDWSGSCICCSTRKPQYRWDAGLSNQDRQTALGLTAHVPPPPTDSQHTSNSGTTATSNGDAMAEERTESIEHALSSTPIAQTTSEVAVNQVFDVSCLTSRDVVVAAVTMLASLLLLPLAFDG